ncbi:MAG: hypothetical protein AB7I27_05865 [Bacteriovoracaceae bacterium]
MHKLEHKEKELHIKLSVEDLTPTQIRLIKSMTALMAHALTAEDESEYFETSSQLLKKAAELIKHANFAEHNKKICYGEQAVEFAVDFLNESLIENKLHNIDN